ncbi:hypothetical protein [Paraburkholderia fungorum]|uniref:hypothetical protein n=1 Tax=Paraburkholderia fungorum TaxID=134537 RepID=UPI0038781074
MDTTFSTLLDEHGASAQPKRPIWPNPLAFHRTSRRDAWSPDEDDVVVATTTADSGAIATTKQDISAIIGNRLFELIRYAIEDGEPLPGKESIAGLWKFLEVCSPANCPLLASGPDGTLVATWRIDNVSMLSMRFLNRLQIEFAWALQDNNGKVSRKWGEDYWKDFVASFPHRREFLDCGK